MWEYTRTQLRKLTSGLFFTILELVGNMEIGSWSVVQQGIRRHPWPHQFRKSVRDELKVYDMSFSNLIHPQRKPRTPQSSYQVPSTQMPRNTARRRGSGERQQ